MANGNPFAPPQVDIAGNINDLITQYRTAQALRKKQELETARKTALQRIMTGQEQDPTAAVMGYLRDTGDIEGGALLAKAVKTTQPAVPKPMTAYQQWQVQHGQTQEAQAEFQKRAAAIPQDRKDYWISNPPAAPAWFREGLSLGGGDTGMPQPVAQPGQTQPAVAAPSPSALPYEKWQAIKSGKMLSPAEAAKHVNLVVTNLDNTRGAAQKLLENPNFDKAFGGLSNVLTRSPSPGAGAGNILPSWAVAGTGIADVQAAVKSLKDQISLAVIANMKEASGKAGSTGLGRVMQIEYAGWQNALGSLEHAQSPEAARASLQNIIDYIDKSKANITGSLAEDYGFSPGSRAGPPAAPPQETSERTGVPGMDTISTPPPPGTVPAATSPATMSYQQKVTIGRQLASQGLNKQQIIDWFKAHGVTVNPDE